MTLDLGFAPLRFEDGIEAGIIDVPGHERFLHNMLAGAAGMELLLLVVDAAEGPRPQTFDHLHILNFLNVRRAIIVLTKRDLVDDEGLALAAELVRDAVAGTIAHDAPVIAVSNLTGDGIGDLKQAIHDALAALPPRNADAPAYLPVDRVFALAGHGTIVTGTLMQGTIKSGDAMILQPSGIAVRVRSLQTFGSRLDTAFGGARVAVNLPAVEVRSIRRGEALVARGAFEPVTEIAIDFRALPAALSLLKRRTPVRAHIGSAEIPGVLVLEKDPREHSPVPARLALQRPVVFYPGSRLIIRRMSPKDLLGGATARARDVGTPADGDDVASSAASDRLDPRLARILGIIAASQLDALDAGRIAAATNISAAAAKTALEQLCADGRIVALQKPIAYLDRTAFDAAFETVEAFVAELHRRKSWSLGAPARDIAQALGVSESAATRMLHAWHDDGRIVQTSRLWHIPGVAPALTVDQRAFFEAALPEEAANPLLPRSYEVLQKQVATSRIEGLREALDMLVDSGALVRIGDDLYRRAQIDRARAILVTLLQKNGGATMSQVRDALNTSRKYALPLMEWFDGIGLTMRDGDLRRLRKTATAPKEVTATP